VTGNTKHQMMMIATNAWPACSNITGGPANFGSNRTLHRKAAALLMTSFRTRRFLKTPTPYNLP